MCRCNRCARKVQDGKSIEPGSRTVVTSCQDVKDAMIVPGSGVQQGNHGYCCFPERRSPRTAGLFQTGVNKGL